MSSTRSFASPMSAEPKSMSLKELSADGKVQTHQGLVPY